MGERQTVLFGVVSCSGVFLQTTASEMLGWQRWCYGGTIGNALLQFGAIIVVSAGFLPAAKKG